MLLLPCALHGPILQWHIGPNSSDGTYAIDVIRTIGGNQSKTDDGTAANVGLPLPKLPKDAPIVDTILKYLGGPELDRQRPFYLQFWSHMGHRKVDPPPQFVARYKDVTFNNSLLGPGVLAKIKQCKDVLNDPYVHMSWNQRT